MVRLGPLTTPKQHISIPGTSHRELMGTIDCTKHVNLAALLIRNQVSVLCAFCTATSFSMLWLVQAATGRKPSSVSYTMSSQHIAVLSADQTHHAEATTKITVTYSIIALTVPYSKIGTPHNCNMLSQYSGVECHHLLCLRHDTARCHFCLERSSPRWHRTSRAAAC